MSDAEPRFGPEEEARFRRLLAERLPRHAAPPRLRAAILAAAAPPPRTSWWAPALSAVATALLLVLVALPLLPPGRPDPLQPVLRVVLSEHTRSLIWGEARPEVKAALPRLMEETGVALSEYFEGDAELRLVNVGPLVVEGRRALALSYRDGEGHLVSYVILPWADLRLPDRGRIQIDRFRPVLTRLDGYSLFAWKQRDLACFLVSDLVSERDLARFKEIFLKVRRGTS